ncbi:cellular communication network factor 1, like 1 isoform X1 [Triplophysa dalaica]|uniref:cellular communication network factor 1, like 1 isoform X1 n=1 Tax=Triplophysa dalaica TaxID=1582913 RepID=UPI0024DF336D|nr:cellular communication network factor 1, like 1 isoform X1 [Triplophysa dalaica]
MSPLRSILRRGHFFTLVLLSLSAVEVQGACPTKCSCPSTVCPPGVSLVLDPCGCCRVCAKQFNQDCSATEPCDHIKGLRCHLGAGGDPETGLCRAEALGRPCELDGRVYQHGEDFKPNCEHQCTCVDGVVGCIPLCPQLVSLPDRRCSRHRLTKLPGRCCQDWVCDDDNRIDEEDQMPDLHPREHTDLTGNELLVAPSSSWDSSAGVAYQEWITSSKSHINVPSTCFLQVTDWSPCSTTCGMGISSRVTNSNTECRLVRETRLCQIRECGDNLVSSLKKGKKCQRTTRPQKPIQITFAGCFSARRYRPRSCGSCSDGRFCTPSMTRTVRLHFYCTGPEQEDFTRNVMWIQRCNCSQRNNQHGLFSQTELLNLPNDIHIYTH